MDEYSADLLRRVNVLLNRRMIYERRLRRLREDEGEIQELLKQVNLDLLRFPDELWRTT